MRLRLQSIGASMAAALGARDAQAKHLRRIPAEHRSRAQRRAMLAEMLDTMRAHARQAIRGGQ